MCGIVFAITKPFAAGTAGFVKDALITSQVRGMDSTGIFQVNSDGAVETLKMACNASLFVKNSDADKILAKVGSSVLTVGHVRAATHGEVNAQNAHPFKAFREDGSYIIGVHNGTLQGWKFKKDATDYQVDSDWAMHILAEEGADAFEYFTGAFAFVWYDSRDPDHLYIAKNKERPLFYMVSRDGKSIVGCSELAMLGWVAGRNGIRTPEKGHEDHFPYYIEDGFIYKFSLKEPGQFTSMKFPAYNPATTIARPLPHHTAGNRDLYHYAGYPDNMYGMGAYQDDFYEDDIPFEMGGRYADRYRDDAASWQETKMENMLTNVKKALHIARWGEDVVMAEEGAEPVVVDHDALERAMHQAIIKNGEGGSQRLAAQMQSRHDQKLGDLIRKGEMFLTSVNSASATSGEIKTAKDTGVFGMVVEFEGIEFDDILKTEMGSFTINVDGEEVTFDGEIRYMTKKLADDLYTDKKALAIVIGAQIKNGKLDWLILERPNSDQLSLCRSMVQQFSDKEAAVN